MAEQRVQRRLAAILAADVVGYSRLMRDDETGTLARLKALRKELLHPKVEEYGGRIVKTTGDGTLIEFPSAVDAVQHAVDVQRLMVQRNAGNAEDARFELRLGINVGDVIVDGDDLYGDGVNVAARIEGLADAGGTSISASVYEQVRHKLELDYDDLGEQMVKNIADPVHVYRILAQSSDDRSEVAVSDDAMFLRPAVAVLPFENLSGDPADEVFADGLTEDVIIALSLWRSFPVIARNSTFAYKGQSPDIRKVGEELGARYVIEGSIHKAGQRIRVTAQLINSENGHHVWAERYDRDLADIFDLQDELSQRIAATVAPELTYSQPAGARTKTPQNLNAWELVQHGYGHVFAIDENSIMTGRDYFLKAIEVDPDYARAYAGIAWSYHRAFWLVPASRTDQGRKEFVDAASRAVSLDDFDSEAHAILAMAWNWCHEIDRAVLAGERAVELNPNNAAAQHILGAALTLQGQPIEGLSRMERAVVLSPRDPRRGAWMWGIGLAYFTAREYEDAVEATERAIQRLSRNPDAYLVLASSLGHLGRIEEARTALYTYREFLPDSSDRPNIIWRYKNDYDMEHFLDGLRKAGAAT